MGSVICTPDEGATIGVWVVGCGAEEVSRERMASENGPVALMTPYPDHSVIARAKEIFWTYLGSNVPFIAGKIVFYPGAINSALRILVECSNLDVVGDDGAILHCGQDEGHVHARVVVLT